MIASYPLLCISSINLIPTLAPYQYSFVSTTHKYVHVQHSI